MSQAFTIYALTCPYTGEARYIGQTSQGVGVRLAQHLLPNRKAESTYRKNWVKSLAKAGKRPGLVVLLTLPTADGLDAAEIFWIKEMRSRGCRLTNLTDGGGGVRGHHHTPAMKAQIARSVKDFLKSPEGRAHCEAQSERLSNRICKPETREKHRARGKAFYAEAQKKRLETR